MQVPRSVTAAAAVLALAVGVPGLAHAQPSGDRIPSASQKNALPSWTTAPPADPSATAENRLPKGWRIDGSGDGKQLVWQSAEPVPMGDSRVEFHAGDRFLGVPVAADDRRTFRLRLDGHRVGPDAELRAQAGGRRLDAGADDAAPPTRISPPAESAAPKDTQPANRVDPGVPGKYRTVSGEYTQKSVRLPGFPRPVEMRAVVVGPTDAPGKRPLALFLHGRHYTCFKSGGAQGGGWPCKGGMKPVPSHRGYLHDQKLLASQGYVTVSISANGVNGQDEVVQDGGAQARSSLVRQHLARWADWSAGRGDVPKAVRDTAPADLSRVLLVGHSRGGEGVNRAALDSLTPPPAAADGAPGPARWTIRGTVLIGPTIFGQNPVPDVPSMTILPGCDGDVSDLQGQIYADGTRRIGRGTALHSAVYVVGANHNFFNSEWTPGQAQAPADDDFQSGERPDAVCAKGKDTRLTAKQQQSAGSTYIAAAARLFVDGDDRVRPLVDGSGRTAPSAKPARVLTHAVGGHRTPAFVPSSSLAVSGGGRLCAQVDPRDSRACLPSGTRGASPHFAAWETSPEPGRHAVALRWTRAGDATKLRPRKPVSLAGADALALRVIVPPNSKGTRLDVTIGDASGRRVRLGDVRVNGLPGTEMTASYWGREVRVPLSAATRAGLDLKKVTSLELTPRNRSGRAWLMDAWGWRPGTPDAGTGASARVDIGQLEVKEGDSGVRTYHVPVRVSGKGSGKVRLFVTDPRTHRTTHRTVTVRPGGEPVEVPVTVRGNKRYGADLSHDVLAKAVRGAVVGSYHGGVRVTEDDPMPKVAVKPIADRVTEGKTLKWRVTLSAAADIDIEAGFEIRRVGGGKELSTKDVGKRWLKDVLGASPNPARPLSKVSEMPYLPAGVAAGKRSVEVSVPTVKDRVREPKESLRLRLVTYDKDWQPHRGPEVTGTVRDPS